MNTVLMHSSKLCSKCLCEKPVSNFSRKYKSYSSYCKLCNSIYLKAHYQNNKHYYKLKRQRSQSKYRQRLRNIIEFYKKKLCADCNIAYPYWIMQFDHIDGNKLFTIGNSTSSRYTSVDNLIAEINKCEVVCANCHANRTYIRSHMLVS